MDTNKAAYWIALGVLALGLNSEYQHGRFVALHRVAEHAGSALCRIATRAEQTLAVARVVRGRQEFPADNLLSANSRAEMARAQGSCFEIRHGTRPSFFGTEFEKRFRPKPTSFARGPKRSARRSSRFILRVRSQFRLGRTVNPE